MYRYKIEELKKWKNSEDRKPLILKGARQVGKTWLMKEFGKNEYEKCAYINLDDNEKMKRLFSGDFDIDPITILEGNQIFVEFKGSLTEQYVLEELKSNIDASIFYWVAEKGEAEIDYITQLENNNIPIEVKSNENLQAKSLKSFIQKYSTKINIRTSMKDFRREDWLINIPLYLIGNIKNIIKL